MKIINSSRMNNQQIRLYPIRELCAALATAPDEIKTPIITAHFDVLTRQTILRLIARVL